MSSEKIKVIIWGTGSLSLIVKETMKKEVDVKGITSSNSDDIAEIENYIHKTDIKYQDYDYLIIASQYTEDIYIEISNLNISFTRVIDYYSYHNNNLKYLKFLENKEKIDTIFMGMSYAEVAYNHEIIGENSYNLANSSEDIYYSYGILKKVLTETDKIHTVILDLPYYFMNYDMSKTKNMKVRANLYINLLKDSHNYELVKFNENTYQKFLIVFDENKISMQTKMNVSGRYKREFKIYERIGNLENIRYNPNYEKYYNRTFYETRKENIKKLMNFIALCNSQNIKLIITVAPTLMRNHKSEVNDARSEFYKTIKLCQIKYKFEIIDFFNDHTFEISDFKYYTHLNYEGSKKISKKLGEYL